MSLKGLTGRVVTPDDPGYAEARLEYNKAVNAFPAIIVYCFDHCDVANAILWSRKHGVELRIRSGGHNYEGYSTGNGKLVIDTTCMNSIKVDTDCDTAEIQAGTRLLPLYETLYDHGYGFPGGTCPSVAISGLVLGGGIGLSTRYLGLTTDSLIEAEVIDADGKPLVANCECNPELFWALRGAGGGNFGVVTSYKFRLPRVNRITLIQLRWDNNIAARNKFISIWQEWLEHLDRRLSSFSGIYKLGAWVNAFFYGQPDEARQLLAPLLAIPGKTLEKIEYLPFIDAVKIIGAGYPKREAFKTAGRFVQRHFSARELAGFADIMDNAPSDRDSSIRVYSLGGAVEDTEASATAFFYRRANYIMAVSSSWQRREEAPLHKAWVNKGFNYMYKITQGSYVNFPYNLTPHYEEAYFGNNVERLEWVKKEYDPCDVFTFPQGIR